MKVNVTFDINKARLVHLDWVLRIESLLDRSETSQVFSLPSYQDCELGLWLHGEGRVKYRQYPDIRNLAIEHRRFHQAVEHMLQAIREGSHNKTRDLLNSARHVSKDIVYLLTLLELKTVEQHYQRQLGGGVLAFLDRWLSPDANWLEPPKVREANPAVDLTYARLAHLRWSSRLDRKFRNFGSGVALQAHDKCDFGSWIQGPGKHKYADLPEIMLLDTVHKSFHEAASRIIHDLQYRQFQKADEAYADVQNLSREISWLLTVLEYRLNPHWSASEGSAGLGRHLQEEAVVINGQSEVTLPVYQTSPIMSAARDLVGGNG